VNELWVFGIKLTALSDSVGRVVDSEQELEFFRQPAACHLTGVTGSNKLGSPGIQ
jgi:hypothetical protein